VTAPRLFAVALLVATTASAQHDPYRPDIEYDGRFTLVRLRWKSDLGFSRRGGFSSAWNHDYPRAEQHLGSIVSELTNIDVRTDGSRILTLDDPELFRHPIAFMWEPGFWNLTDREAVTFRDYLLKGGFAIFEDFDGPAQWANFEAQMRRVLPDGRFVDLDASQPIFHSFFEIDSLAIVPQYYDQGKPVFRGLFEDNDPAKRLMVMANYNTDISNFWEFSATGFKPIDESNEAYKLGVDYIIYGLTH